MTDSNSIDVRRLRLAPGDVLVAKVDGDVDQGEAYRLRAVLQNVLAEAGHPETRVLIIAGETELEVLTAAQAGAVLHAPAQVH